MPKPRLTGWPLHRAFLADIFGKDADKAWVAGFPDIDSGANWKGGRGVDYLESRGLDPEAADLYFCIGLMRDGANSRSLGEVVAQPLLIVDDIGTKIDRATWEMLFALGMPAPTFRIETSPGNETWGWSIKGSDRDPQRWEDLALIRAYLVSRDLTDAVMDATRYIRLPGGWNSKGKYKVDNGGVAPGVSWKAWQRGKRVDIDEIGQAICGGGDDWRDQPMPAAGMTSAQLGGLGAGALNRCADLAHPEPLIQMATELGMNPIQIRAGVVEAACPNIAEHGDRAETGFAFLGNGLMECNHASCQGLRSTDFRALMEDAYNAWIDVRVGLGEDVSGVALSANEYLARASFGSDKTDKAKTANDAAAMAGRVGAAAVGRALDADAALDRLVGRFIHVNGALGFFDTVDRKILGKEQLCDHEVVVPVIPAGGTGGKRACNVLINHPDCQKAQGVTHVPGDMNPVVSVPDENGIPMKHVNTWTPSQLQERPGSPDVWLALVSHVIPHKEFRDWYIDRLAFHVQHPGVRTPIIPLIAGGQGIGKDLMLKPFMEVIGTHNMASVSMQELDSQFNAWQRREIILLPELKLSAGGGLYNKLKDWTGAADTRITINEKYARPYSIRPVSSFFAFTNHLDAVKGMEADDRRMAVYVTDAEPKPKSWYAQNAPIIESEAEAGRLKRFLMHRDLSDFDAHAPAPDVEGSRRTMLADALVAPARWVYDQCQVGGLFVGRRWLTLGDVEQAGQSASNRMAAQTMNSRAAQDGLRAAGCDPLGKSLRAGRDKFRPWFGPGQDAQTRVRNSMLAPKQITVDVLADRKEAQDHENAALGIGPSKGG